MSLTRREWLQAGLAGLAAGVVRVEGEEAGRSSSSEFSFHTDHVLGTSLDVWMTTPHQATAEQAAEVILAEIERLRRIFSTYDPDSELSRLNRTREPVPVSSDLFAVLHESRRWQSLSGGACNPLVGSLLRLWSEAERAGTPPGDFQLARVAEEIREPGYTLDAAHGTVTRHTDHALNLNAVAKGYVLQRSVEVVRANVPQVRGLLLNLGGDLLAWGQAPPRGWLLGVQDPRRPEENASPLTALRLAEGAVATSGGYQRFFTIAGRCYSHLIDPRSGLPATGLASATVLAPSSLTANALATTLCVLDPEAGLRLVAHTPGAACLLVTADGRLLRSAGFAAVEVAGRAEEPAAKGEPDVKEGEKEKPPAWPADHQVTVALELPRLTDARRYRRPYVAVWIEGPDGKPLRTIAVWGRQPRWIPTLTDWWKIARDNNDLVKAVTRATRAPGKYTVVWDGKDDKGMPLPQGTYTIRIEVHREHGKHVLQTGKITCAAEPAQVTLKENAETGTTTVTYGKKEKE
jgi:thiamine biosynthesis lipoprotein ApbE